MSTGDGHGEVRLTHRERDVLVLIGQGLSAKQVALRLDISPKTVEAYADHVRLKLGAANRCHMISIAAAKGLLDGRD